MLLKKRSKIYNRKDRCPVFGMNVFTDKDKAEILLIIKPNFLQRRDMSLSKNQEHISLPKIAIKFVSTRIHNVNDS